MKNSTDRKAGRPATGKNWPVSFNLMLSEEMKQFVTVEAAAQEPKISECALIRSFFPRDWKARLRRRLAVK